MIAIGRRPAKPWKVENGSGTCCRLPWQVLVLRARYWHRLPGQYFMDVLEAFLRVNEFSSAPSFEMFITLSFVTEQKISF